MHWKRFLKLPNWVFLVVMLLLSLVMTVVALLNGETSYGLLLNLGTELLGTLLAFFVFQVIIESRDKNASLKEKLIRDLMSDNTKIRDLGIEELKERDWFKNGDFSGLNFEGAPLQGANFMGSRLVYANFFGSDCSNAIFDNANLNGADMRGAILENASFFDTVVKNVDFEDAYLENANLKK